MMMNNILRTRFSAVIALLIFGVMPAFGQTAESGRPFKKAEWSRIKMDSAFDGAQRKSSRVITGYKATSPSLLKPVGKCDEKLESQQLSDFVIDAMLDYAAQRLSRAMKDPQAKADMAIVKFRDADVCLQAGDVTPLDIISLFSFDNQTIIVDIKGKYMRELVGKSVEIGAILSQPAESYADTIEDDRIYKVITIDYLLGQPATAEVLKHAEKLQNCNTPLSNTIILHVKRLTQKGETINGRK